jgi:hypothetical protein
MGGGEDPPSERAPDRRSPLEGLSDEDQVVLARVAEVLKRLRFGTILLVVQDGKVVQIEMAEKIRLR